jgi:hypothetical protein
VLVLVLMLIMIENSFGNKHPTPNTKRPTSNEEAEDGDQKPAAFA